jgi:hypothetical protein
VRSATSARTVEFDIRTQHRAGNGQAGAGGVEAGGGGLGAGLLQQVGLATPEVEVPGQVEALAAFPADMPGIGRRHQVLAAEFATGLAGIEVDARIQPGLGDGIELLGNAHASQGLGQGWIVRQGLLHQPVELGIAIRLPPGAVDGRRGLRTQAEMRCRNRLRAVVFRGRRDAGGQGERQRAQSKWKRLHTVHLCSPMGRLARWRAQ